MNSSDVIGLAIIILVLLGGLYALHRMSKPVVYTKLEYEKRLSKSSGIARSAMNAMMYPFEELLHPKIVEAIHVKKDMNAGHYDVQQENGNGFDEHGLVIAGAHREIEARIVQGRTNRVGIMLRRILSVFRSRR